MFYVHCQSEYRTSKEKTTMKYPWSLALLSVVGVTAIAPASAQLGRILNVPGLTQPGGGSFAATGAQMAGNVVVGLRSMATAVLLMNQAVGNQASAKRMQAVVDELNGMKNPDQDGCERALKGIDDNAVDRSSLAKAHDAKSKQQLAQSAGYVVVAGFFDARAVDNAKQIGAMKPGPTDALSAPSLLNTAVVVTTAFPAQINHLTQYGSMLSTYMSDNRLTPPSKEDQRTDAQAQGASSDQIAAMAMMNN
jgi:hypothetical protein